MQQQEVRLDDLLILLPWDYPRALSSHESDPHHSVPFFAHNSYLRYKLFTCSPGESSSSTLQVKEVYGLG